MLAAAAAAFVSSFGCLIISVRAPVLLKAWRRSVLVPDQFLSHQPATLFPSISPGVGHEAPTLGGVAGNAAGGRHNEEAERVLELAHVRQSCHSSRKHCFGRIVV